ncbi:hypothetical protein GL50803_0015954 [Giardia duodenalis]|uniref:Uncharacterized protein n=1 Tax=Giardia intestinalis (strain ATCC 50803 / WB clone C6) TaxID=184922 RepID=A8BGN9_GIAIC|nr:hypothetical protein GL50803_0015954 [Giardia intestinalis]KAE8302144.1 hypothetical protein GL50803_0015954 [Giardia intestinalis]|eukprot:XP_001707222.1 Hypothetical protein GL50803_15954 [Giardia lamblia ATCC 50803]
MRLRMTDYLAILAAILIVPFCFLQEQGMALEPVTSALRVYGNEYYEAHVKAGLITGVVETVQEGKVVEAPHLLLPLYDPYTSESLVDAVMLVGLQRAMSVDRCYAASRYTSPYQHKASVLTVNRMKPAICKTVDLHGAEDPNHPWQYEAYSAVVRTGAMGHIRHLIQENPPTLNDERILKTRVRSVDQKISTKLMTDFAAYKTRRYIAGVTDTLEVFLLTRDMKTLWVNKELGDLFQMELDAFSTFQIVSHKVEISENTAIVSAVARSPTGDGLVLLAALSLTTGAAQWINTATIPSRAWSTRMLKDFEPEWLLSEIDAVCEVYNVSEIFSAKSNNKLPKRGCSLDEKKARKLGLSVKDHSWEILRRYLRQRDVFNTQHNVHRLSHGVSHYIIAYDDDYISGISGLKIVAFHSPTFIALLDEATGEEIAAYSVMPGVLLEPGAEYGEVFISYLSDRSLKQAKTYDVKYYDYIRVRSVNGTLTEEIEHLSLSERSTLLSTGATFDEPPDPIKSLVGPILHLDERLNSHLAFFLTPGGVIYALSTSTNAILWRTAVTDFIPTSLNAHMSIQWASGSHSVLVFTMGTRAHIFDLYNGKEMAIFKLPEDSMQHADTADVFHDDEGSRASSTILFARLHPTEHKNAILLTSGPYLDIIEMSLPNEALASYWERACMFVLVATIFISALRIMPSLATKTE